MGEELESREDWPRNYFNYFTEIEEHFQRARGTGLFLLSPLDWALIEVWKESGVPLEAVLRGIDAAFEKWRSRKSRTQQINSLAYCAQAVQQQAQQLARSATPVASAEPPPPFSAPELENYLRHNALLVRQTGHPALEEISASLERLAGEVDNHLRDLESLEQRLTALEDKLLAIARAEQKEEDLFQARRELDQYLRPYRGRMTAAQLTMLEKQFLDRWLLEKLGVPRLSLFYLR
ncbi:MAG: hypothetical protein NZV14_13150 [Bryobacteraceae bacterium]|nr:hypothetical protein [Bryobacteraceae bacterium]MDW8379103.1 hypothetical protein [Bryobacterales bacterium]